jgi:hypothetical protein
VKKVVAVCLIISMVGCYAIRYTAPVGQEVRLMSTAEPPKAKFTKKVWYVLWGLIPITDNSTEDIIQKYKLKNVRAESKMTFVDFLISAVLGNLSVVTMTIEVEGEPAQ